MKMYSLKFSGSADKSAVTKFDGKSPSPLLLYPFHQLWSESSKT